MQRHAACLLIVPLNDAGRTNTYFARSVKAPISAMQACDSLRGDVGGKNISTAKVFSILISISLIMQHTVRSPFSLKSVVAKGTGRKVFRRFTGRFFF